MINRNDTNIDKISESNGATLLSIIVPVHNEEDNIKQLVEEIELALDGYSEYEIIYVDDGSTDNSFYIIHDLAKSRLNLRILRSYDRCGQSSAIYSGILAASGQIIVTLDGDGQNDPADIPRLLETFNKNANRGGLMIIGWRKLRNDGWVKRITSYVANGIRSGLLSDHTPDTGCGLKVFRKDEFLRLPTFNHMHRFLPALTLRAGGKVLSLEVNHRPRQNGKSKYGTFDRLLVGLIDLFGVVWLNRRTINVITNEVSISPDENNVT